MLTGDVILLKKAAAIQIGKYCYIGERTTIVPPEIKPGTHGPMTIGGYCIVGHDSKVQLANIGNRVLIEPHCNIGNLAIIYDCCVIREGAVIPPRMVIPPYSEVKGIPGENFEVRELHNGYKRLIETEARELQVLGQRSKNEIQSSH